MKPSGAWLMPVSIRPAPGVLSGRTPEDGTPYPRGNPGDVRRSLGAASLDRVKPRSAQALSHLSRGWSIRGGHGRGGCLRRGYRCRTAGLRAADLIATSIAAATVAAAASIAAAATIAAAIATAAAAHGTVIPKTNVPMSMLLTYCATLSYYNKL